MAATGRKSQDWVTRCSEKGTIEGIPGSGGAWGISPEEKVQAEQHFREENNKLFLTQTLLRDLKLALKATP